jgi:hypothetical protein
LPADGPDSKAEACEEGAAAEDGKADDVDAEGAAIDDADVVFALSAAILHSVLKNCAQSSATNSVLTPLIQFLRTFFVNPLIAPDSVDVQHSEMLLDFRAQEHSLCFYIPHNRARPQVSHCWQPRVSSCVASLTLLVNSSSRQLARLSGFNLRLSLCF